MLDQLANLHTDTLRDLAPVAAYFGINRTIFVMIGTGSKHFPAVSEFAKKV